LDSVYSSASHRLIQIIKSITAIPGLGKWGKYLQNTCLPEERQALLTRWILGSNMLQINNGEPCGPMGGTKAESAAGKRGRPIEPAPGNAGEGTLEFELPFPGS
jgi:hypothetical protein